MNMNMNMKITMPGVIGAAASRMARRVDGLFSYERDSRAIKGELPSASRLKVKVVSAHQRVDMQGKPLVVFIVMCRFDETEWNVEKRFSQFFTLDQELSRLLGWDLSHFLPELPRRSLFIVHNPEHIEQRRMQLDKYMNGLARLAANGSSAFGGAKEEDLAAGMHVLHSLYKFVDFVNHVIPGMGDRALDEEEDENVASESTGPTQSPELALALAQVKRVKEKLADARIRGESDKKLKHDLGLQLVRLSEQVQEHQDQASELAVEIQNRMKIRCETNEWMETKRMKDELNSYRDQRISRIARQTPFASSPLRIGPWRVDPGRYEDFKNLKVVEQINKAASESLSRCSENEVSCEEFSSSTPALLLRENADLTWLLCSAIERRAKLDKQLEDAHVSGRSGGLDDVIRPFVGSEASTRGWMEFSPRHGSRESSPSSSAAATKSPLLLEPKRLFNSGAPSNSGGQDEGGKRERDWTLRGIKGSIMNRLARLESPQPPPSSSSSSPINSKRVELEAVDLGAVVSSLSRFMEEGTYLLVSQLEDVRQARKEVESESAGLQEECERMERELARLQSERDDAVARAAADAKIKLELAEQERKKQLRKDVGAMP